MKSVLRLTVAISCLISVALLSGCGGGLSQQPLQRLTIAPAALPNGTSEMPYNQTIHASGGVAPFTWTVSTGALPHNVALSSSATNTVTISGTPDTAAQGLAFTIKVTDSASQSASQSYTLSILLEPDTLTLAPSSLSFTQLVGTPSGAQAETVTNNGTSTVVISSIALSGTNAADFGQSNTCGSSIGAGANCTINAAFTPSQLGPRSAAITMTDSTVGSPHSVSLSGVGLTSGSNAAVSATTLTFATQLVGTTSPVQSITLSNYGTTALNITSISHPANFGESDNCQGSTLVSGANCTINVTFTPPAAGSVTGTIAVTDNASSSPQTVTLSGTGATTSYSLTGYCFHPVRGASLCTQTQDSLQCPVGQPATTTSITSCSSGGGAVLVDTSMACQANGGSGHCVAN